MCVCKPTARLTGPQALEVSGTRISARSRYAVADRSPKHSCPEVKFARARPFDSRRSGRLLLPGRQGESDSSSPARPNLRRFPDRHYAVFRYYHRPELRFAKSFNNLAAECDLWIKWFSQRSVICRLMPSWLFTKKMPGRQRGCRKTLRGAS